MPSLACLFLAIFRFSAQLYRLLYRDEEMAVKGMLWLMLIALKYAVPAQVGNYLGAKSGSIARLSPRAFGKLHCF